MGTAKVLIRDEQEYMFVWKALQSLKEEKLGSDLGCAFDINNIEHLDRRLALQRSLDDYDLRVHPDRKGDWFPLYSGRRFWPCDPRPEDIDIENIAHSLSLINRFNGHTREAYCPTLDQRVLTADLRWVPCGDLKVGDELLAFDEHPKETGSAGTLRRRFRYGTVTGVQPHKRRIVRLEMEDGSTVRCSVEHPWLVATKQSRNQKWMTSSQIALDLACGKKRYMHKFVPLWKFNDSWQSGWVAGILDGEGSFSAKNRKDVQLSLAQNRGLVLHKIDQALRELGVSHLRYHQKTSTCLNLQIRGGWRAMMQLLGTTRPVRLLDKFVSYLQQGHLDKQLDGDGYPLLITKVYDEDEEWVAGLETSTHTYFCEGYAAHNSVAQHCVHVTSLLPEKYQLFGLLHDAGECYLGDVITPVKRLVREFYEPLEEGVMQAVAGKFGFQMTLDARVAVKKADTIMLMTEIRDLTPSGVFASVPQELPRAEKIERCWSAQTAEFTFRVAFNGLLARARKKAETQAEAA